MTARTGPNSEGPWHRRALAPHRLAFATWIAAIPLVLFGGTVTTLRAGMAESNWINPDGHFLWFYPLAMRVRNVGTFVEHHHREFGTLVGLLAIATALSAWLVETRRLARVLPFVALLAVSLQGVIGGLRVLENSPRLAFLHGVIGQAVFALLAATALYLSPRFQSVVPGACKTAASLQRTTAIGVVIVFLQVAIGAWYRHSRLNGEPLAETALALHVMFALGALGAVVAIARQMRATVLQGAQEGGDRSVLLGVKRRLHSLVGVQILLGALATFWIYEQSSGEAAQVSTGEAVFATAHVLVGALLLAQTVAAAMWARRVVCTQQAELAPSLEGAR